MDFSDMFDEYSIAYGKIRGMLEVFALLNDDVNYQCAFTFERLEKPADAQSAVAAYLAEMTHKVELAALENQQERLQLILEYWLFGFELPPELHPSRMQPFFVPPQEAYQLLSEPKKQSWTALFVREPEHPGVNALRAERWRSLAAYLVTAINLLVEPVAVWEVSMPEGTLGVCPLRSDILAFENRDSIFVLQWGFCD